MNWRWVNATLGHKRGFSLVAPGTYRVASSKVFGLVAGVFDGCYVSILRSTDSRK